MWFGVYGVYGVYGVIGFTNIIKLKFSQRMWGTPMCDTDYSSAPAKADKTHCSQNFISYSSQQIICGARHIRLTTPHMEHFPCSQTRDCLSGHIRTPRLPPKEKSSIMCRRPLVGSIFLTNSLSMTEHTVGSLASIHLVK